jgi:hypothetical protein
MNAELLRRLLASQAFVTLFMAGLVRFVPVVHFPLGDRLGKADLVGYEQQHARRNG